MNKVGKPKVKKEGWKDRTEAFRTVIVQQPTFNGIVFMLGQVPLRKIGISQSGVVIPGTPSQVVINASHKQAPPYRIVISREGFKCYVKGTPPVLLS